MPVHLNDFKFCVYAHIVDGKIIYIGSGGIDRAVSFHGTNRSDTWNDIVNGRSVTVRILAIFGSREDSLAFEAAKILALLPPANINGKATKGKYMGPVRCVQTGEVYRTISEAAQLTGISRSAVSNSVSGRHPVVQGKTFERYEGHFLAALPGLPKICFRSWLAKQPIENNEEGDFIEDVRGDKGFRDNIFSRTELLHYLGHKNACTQAKAVALDMWDRYVNDAV